MVHGSRDAGPGSPAPQNNSAKAYMQLDAWKLADDLAVETFQIGRTLPADLRWLSLQLSRAATSVPANIAEGYHRSSLREYVQFLSVARGSLAEVEYFLHFLRRTDLVDRETHERLSQLANRTGQTLSRLIASLKAKLPPSAKRRDLTVRETVPEYLLDDGIHPGPATRDPGPGSPP